MAAELPLRDRVFAIVALVPAGSVVSYGDIAGMLGMSPRMVGRYLALGDPAKPELPWWRVVDAAGDLPPHVRQHALLRWEDEGLPLKPTGRGVPITRYRADLATLADAAEEVLGPLPGVSG